MDMDRDLNPALSIDRKHSLYISEECALSHAIYRTDYRARAAWDKCLYQWVPRIHLSLWVVLTCLTDQPSDLPAYKTLLSDSGVGDNDDDEKRGDRERDVKKKKQNKK